MINLKIQNLPPTDSISVVVRNLVFLFNYQDIDVIKTLTVVAVVVLRFLHRQLQRFFVFGHFFLLDLVVVFFEDLDEHLFRTIVRVPEEPLLLLPPPLLNNPCIPRFCFLNV